MKTFQEIQAKIDNKKRLTYISILVFILFLGLFILVNRYNLKNDFYQIPLIILAMLAQMILPFESELSAYDRVRYSAHYLNISLNNRDTKKAIFYLNKLASNIETLNRKMESFPSQEHAIGVLVKVLMLLKYKIYPDLLNNENLDNCATIFENIQKAIEKGNINRLGNLIQDYTFENTENIILLPYEKPNILIKILIDLLSTVVGAFYKNFVFRLMIIIIFLSTIGYLISDVTVLTFDTTLFSAILVLSFGLTKELNKK